VTDEPFEFDYTWDIGAPDGDITRTEYRGRFWFDERWEVDLKIIGDGSIITVKYAAANNNFVDLTDYRPLARFLRWVLRR